MSDVKLMSDSDHAFMEPLRILWDYLRCPAELRPCPCIVGFGNYNTDIPKRAAELYFQGYAPRLLFTGGLGRNTLGRQSGTEAECFAAAAIAEGVPEADILIESRSTNTRDNILFTRELLAENGILPDTLIGVHQPFMERRIRAAFDVYWPEAELLTTSPQVDIPAFFDHAALCGIDRHTVIEELVGDFQRMELYADRGWQSRQFIPPEADAAFRELVRQGYGGQLA